MADHERLLLLAVYSRGAALERLAGMRGVVQLLLRYMHCDDRILRWSSRVYTLAQIRNNSGMLDFCIDRFRLPQLTLVEAAMGMNLLEQVRYAQRFDYDEFSDSIVKRMFDHIKHHSFSLPLTRSVYQIYAATHGYGRFARKEFVRWPFAALEKEGIVLTCMGHDYEAMSAELRSETGDCVQLDLVFVNDYPFKAPIVAFTGETRPSLFATKAVIRIEDYFDYGFAGVEEILRTLLVEMNCGGVVKLPLNEVAVGFHKLHHVSGAHRLVADGANGAKVVDLKCAS
jgi:hypothetical protein